MGSMSLPDPVLRYSLDSVSTLGLDLSGNGHDATVSNVNIARDATYGDVADFAGSGSIKPTSIPSAFVGGAARTISVWVNMDANGNNGVVFSQSDATGSGNLLRILIGRNGNEIRFENSWSHQNYTQSLSNGVWYHLVLSFDGTSSTTYFQGSELGSKNVPLNTGTNIVGIGDNYYHGFDFDGQMADFRIYDTGLSSTQVNTIFTEGPQPAFTLNLTLYFCAINLVWSTFPSASSYTIMMNKDGSGFSTIAYDLDPAETTFTIFNLDHGSTYDFEIYSDLDQVTPFVSSTGNVTPVIDTTEGGRMLSLLTNDLSVLSTTNIDKIDDFLHGYLTTNENLTARISFNNSVSLSDNIVYVAESDQITLSESQQSPILTPFILNGSPSQSFNLVLSDTTTVAVTYNEVTGTITVDGQEHSVGDRIILDGKEVKIAELN